MNQAITKSVSGSFMICLFVYLFGNVTFEDDFDFFYSKIND